MSELEEAKLGFGSITFVQKQPEVATRTEHEGNTTINYVGTPERPAYFEADYFVTSTFKNGEEDYLNSISWKVRLPAQEPTTVPYAQLEAEGARLIAPMLRAVADAVEAQVAAFDASRREEDEMADRQA